MIVQGYLQGAITLGIRTFQYRMGEWIMETIIGEYIGTTTILIWLLVPFPFSFLQPEPGTLFPGHQNSPKALYSIVFGPKSLNI